MVCTGRTNHAEVVQIKFDPQVITFREILEVFFSTHDPTTPNRQGADKGTQYRSIILYHDEKQKDIAENVISELNDSESFNDKIVTQVTSLWKIFMKQNLIIKLIMKKTHMQGIARL